MLFFALQREEQHRDIEEGEGEGERDEEKKQKQTTTTHLTSSVLEPNK
jgi:hypothetical protein